MRAQLKLIILLFTVINITSLNAQIANLKVTKSAIFKDKNTNSEIIFSVSDEKDGVMLVRQLSSRFWRKSRGYFRNYNYKILISSNDSKVFYKTQAGIFSNGIMFFEGNKGRDKSIVKIEL